MFKNAAEFSKRYSATVFFIVATALMVWALISYNPERVEPVMYEMPEERLEDLSIGYDTELDDIAWELIKGSHFAFIRRAEVENFVNYELYVKEPLTDELSVETEAINKQLSALWAEHNKKVRVLVLNYTNQELVDLMTEDGKTIFKRL